MSRAEYEQLTEMEKMFITKEYENKFMSDTTWTRNAVLNAEINANRKKSKPFVDLFPKKQVKADIGYNENAVKTIMEIEEKNGKSWVDKIYGKVNFKSPKKGGN